MKRKEEKRAEARQRQARWESLSIEEKLTDLQHRPGFSKREVMKLKGGKL